jgi:hypothetical protein
MNSRIKEKFSEGEQRLLSLLIFQRNVSKKKTLLTSYCINGFLLIFKEKKIRLTDKEVWYLYNQKIERISVVTYCNINFLLGGLLEGYGRRSLCVPMFGSWTIYLDRVRFQINHDPAADRAIN